MAATFELIVYHEGGASHAVPVGREPVSVGRGPTNDLVVSDGVVSWEHLKIWSDKGRAWCSDAGSTNGTFVNGKRIAGTVELAHEDTISLGGELNLRVRSLIDENALKQASRRAIALEEVASGVKHPFRSNRFVVGGADDADLRVDGAQPYAAEFAVHEADDIWVIIGTEDRPIALNEEIEVSGLTLRLVEVGQQRADTILPTGKRFSYRLAATMDGPTGPVAKLTDLDAGVECRIEAETRAILMYFLGTRFQKDLDVNPIREEVGWVPDDDAIIAVWGRSGLPDGSNRLKVLVHRLRSEFERAGLDPWIIERRRRHIRLRIREFADAFA